MGSPRIHGNTAELCKPFIEELIAQGSLWAGKAVANLATHGYDRAYAVDPFELGVRRLCEHSRLRYLGLYSVRDVDDLASFRTEEAQSGARAFARALLR